MSRLLAIGLAAITLSHAVTAQTPQPGPRPLPKPLPQTQQMPQPQAQQSLQPPTYTIAMETTLRPNYSSTDLSATYSPIPITPDLGQIADSIASQPSVANAMRNAKVSTDCMTGHGEL
ncbi:hypothetical protein H4R26_001920 [Coemansia thaxteri]|uniref:Uncharacterized protein n=1 Tax=Coemansia thaxteri TaxID=2663907 RepID=A0A9W8EK16_9FUNG|nr:hypothetical protein H4R26_001920 [Coemansia thaxteri]KAJ2485423.1 hypothetical protein EV174_001738 [Coemansia sp. RSA 2320]